MRGPLVLLTLAVLACADDAPPVYTLQPVALAFVPRDLVLEDLEGDGRLELVAVGDAGVSVRRWADGRFDVAAVRSLPDAAAGLAVADLDGDGRLDLATGLPLRSAIAWLPDLATGEPVREIAVDAAVRGLAAGDVDGDGLTDLIAAVEDEDVDELLLLRGGPGGPKLIQRLPFAEVNALAVVDLDADGRSEVAVSSLGRGRVQLLTPTADGLLEPGEVVWQTSFPVALAAADLDGDGAGDLAAVDTLARRVWVGLGNGAGGWRSRSQWEIDVEPAALLARRGPDGPELVISGADGRSLLLIDPRTGVARVRAAKRDRQVALAAGDLDGDGIDELVHTAGILRDTIGDNLRSHGPPVGPATRSLVRVDLDGDGSEELVVEEAGRGELVVYEIDGADLRERSRVPAPPDLAGLRPLARGDGGYDLGWWGRAGFGVLTGDGLQGMSTVEQTAVADLVPLHLDDDGVAEVAVVLEILETVPGAARYYYSGSVLLTLRAGDSVLPFTPVFEGGRVTAVVPTRLDEHAGDDLWIAHDEGVMALRSGDAWAAVAAGPLTNLTGAQAVDLDADGIVDLVGCDAGLQRGLLAAHGLGDGALGPTVRLAETSCRRLHACEGDGEAPVLVVERGSTSDFIASAAHASLEILRLTDARWGSGGSLYPGLEAEQLAVRCAADGFSVWTGGGRGLALQERVAGPALVEQSTTPRLSPALLGDLDGDDLDDLIDDDEPRLMLARGDGAGGFTPAVSQVRPDGPVSARVVGLGEFDGEPGAELVVAETDLDGVRSHALWSLRGDRVVRTHALATVGWDVLGDFDGDGRDELLTRDGERPALVRPDAEPDLLAPELFLGLQELRAADMDGDGRTDLLAGTNGMDGRPAALRLLRSEGPGFSSRVLPVAAALYGLGVGVGDLDHDGALELVAVDPFLGITVCRRGNAGPADSCETKPWADAPLASLRVVIADFDGDSDPDLVLGWSRPKTGSFVQVMRGDGAGGLHPTPAQPLADGHLRPARLGGDRPGWVVLNDIQAFVLTTEQTP